MGSIAIYLTPKEEEQTEKAKTMAFRDWTLQKLDKTFHLKRRLQCPLLDDWTMMPFEIPANHLSELEILRQDLFLFADTWNEDELKWNFISVLMKLVNYRTATYNIFLNRPIQAQVNNYTLKGFVDAVIATGMYEPEAPFFCFHEYKREKGTNDDPRGQLLSAMLAAQKLNSNDKPVYGAYVIGRNWFFVVLEGKEYCISNNFSATHKDELQQVYKLLANLKVIIETQLL